MSLTSQCRAPFAAPGASQKVQRRTQVEMRVAAGSSNWLVPCRHCHPPTFSCAHVAPTLHKSPSVCSATCLAGPETCVVSSLAASRATRAGRHSAACLWRCPVAAAPGGACSSARRRGSPLAVLQCCAGGEAQACPYLQHSHPDAFRNALHAAQSSAYKLLQGWGGRIVCNTPRLARAAAPTSCPLAPCPTLLQDNEAIKAGLNR